jgi:hypothetical protein
MRMAPFDELGLSRALADRAMTLLTTAMAFLAALAIAGWLRSTVLTSERAGATLTVEVPKAGKLNTEGSRTRLTAVQALLIAAPGVGSAEVLSGDRLNALLRPWLGTDVSDLYASVPAVIAVQTTRSIQELAALRTQLEQTAPGTTIEDYASWAAGRASLLRAHAADRHDGDGDCDRGRDARGTRNALPSDADRLPTWCDGSLHHAALRPACSSVGFDRRSDWGAPCVFLGHYLDNSAHRAHWRLCSTNDGAPGIANDTNVVAGYRSSCGCGYRVSYYPAHDAPLAPTISMTRPPGQP